MTTTHEFEGATATVARTFSREAEIKVIFAGDGAKTGKGVVFLPKLPEGATLSKTQVDTTRGYVDHEIGHQLMTPMEPRKGARFTRFTKAMVNAIEDVRVEQGLAKMYPAMRENLRVTSGFVNGKVGEQMEADPAVFRDWKRVLPLVTTWAGRHLMGYDSGEGELLGKLPEDVRKLAFEVAGAALKIETGVDEFGKLDREAAHRHHEKVVELARKWGRKAEAEYKKEEDEPPPPPPPPTPPSDEEGDEEAAPAPSDGDEPDDGAKAEAEDSPEPTKATPAPRPPLTPLEGGMERALEVIASTEFEPEFIEDGYRPYTRAWDRILHRTTPAGSWDDEWTDKYLILLRHSSGVERYAMARSLVSSHLMAMRRKLERALLARKDVQWVGGYSHGQRVDLRRGADIVRGMDASWRRRVADENLDAAVTMLVDLSGSMGGERARLAQLTTIALGEALDMAGVPFEIVGFHNPVYANDAARFVMGGHLRELMRKAQREYEADVPWGRTIPFCMPVFKKFDEPMRMAKGAIGMLTSLVGGGNSDCDGLLYAGQRLMRRHEGTRVMLVLSDGHPSVDGYGNSDQLPREMHRQVARLASNGVSCVGVGIMDTSVRRFYPRHVVVNSAADLGGETTDLLGKVLLGQGFKADVRELLRAA